MDKKLLSIIIPVYNVENYICECLDSVLGQSYTNIEVLLIDDGSTDKSGEICDEYQKKDSRVKVFHKENGGLSTARNVGIEQANGFYVAFVDSDDYIETTMYSQMISVLEKEKAELVVCAFNNVSDTKKECTGNSGNITSFNTEEIFLNKDKIRFLTWNKVYLKSKIDEIRFIPGQVYEDVYFNRHIFLRCTKVAYLDKPLYNYRVSRPGNTNSVFKLGRLCIFAEFDALQEQLEFCGYADAQNEMIIYAMEFYRRLYKEALELKADVSARKMIRKNYIEYFMKARKRHLKLKKGFYIFFFVPGMLCRRDIYLQNRNR